MNINLNPDTDQQIVINTREGAYSLLSGPGSGKTTTLIGRYHKLRESGVRSSEILGITFTKEAATVMGSRANGNFRTFHSFGYEIIAKEKGRPPMEPELRLRLLYRLMRKYGLDYKELTSFISRMRHADTSPEQAIEEFPYGFPQAFAEYERERIAQGWIDFDSMIRDAVNLLEDESVRRRYQYPFIMADECQDTDDLQFRFLQLMAQKHGNIMCIGDPGQSIYMFRGAQPDNLVNFDRWFPGCKYLYLGRNYRSTQTITEYVQKHYPLEIELKKKITPVRQEKGVPIEYRQYDFEEEEAEAALVSAQGDPLNSAILARTNRQLATVENFCDENNIPYTLLGKSGFWKQAEIRKVVEKLKPFLHLPIQPALSMVMPNLERHYQVEDSTPEDNYALENIRKFRDIILTKKFGTCREVVAYATKRIHAKRLKKGVTLSTVHQAKGCEWKNVFVIGVRDGVMPHAKGDWSEERRIFMVAISRAMDRLRLSFTGAASAFIRNELTDEILLTMQPNSGRVERLQKQQSLF